MPMAQGWFILIEVVTIAICSKNPPSRQMSCICHDFSVRPGASCPKYPQPGYPTHREVVPGMFPLVSCQWVLLSAFFGNKKSSNKIKSFFYKYSDPEFNFATSKYSGKCNIWNCRIFFNNSKFLDSKGSCNTCFKKCSPVLKFVQHFEHDFRKKASAQFLHFFPLHTVQYSYFDERFQKSAQLLWQSFSHWARINPQE